MKYAVTGGVVDLDAERDEKTKSELENRNGIGPCEEDPYNCIVPLVSAPKFLLGLLCSPQDKFLCYISFTTMK